VAAPGGSAFPFGGANSAVRGSSGNCPPLCFHHALLRGTPLGEEAATPNAPDRSPAPPPRAERDPRGVPLREVGQADPRRRGP